MAFHFVDLDRFKAINDTYGHAAGDDVLRVVARRLERIVRERDVTARLGGDEFVIVQSDVLGARDVEILARRIVDVLAVPIRVDGLTYEIGASVGVAVFPADGDNPEDLLARADAALYEVKKRGRGAFSFANPAFAGTPVVAR